MKPNERFRIPRSIYNLAVAIRQLVAAQIGGAESTDKIVSPPRAILSLIVIMLPCSS